MRWRFDGEIAGFGTHEGTRVVVGRWRRSPFGAFSDVMVERADGRRLLIAPDEAVAGFVAGTYAFDAVHVAPVLVRDVPPVAAASPAGAVRGWDVHAGPLHATVGIGPRTLLGRVLRCVPPALAGSPGWTRVTDPVARTVLRGVRTRGRARGARREYYGATDAHRVVEVDASWDGRPLGPLAPIRPPVRFGFGSTPSSPTVTRLVTTVEEDRSRVGRRDGR